MLIKYCNRIVKRSLKKDLINALDYIIFTDFFDFKFRNQKKWKCDFKQ